MPDASAPSDDPICASCGIERSWIAHDDPNLYNHHAFVPAAPSTSPTVPENSDEGMLREAHDVLYFAMQQWSNPPMPWQWLAADLMERLNERFPDAKDVV